MRTILKFAIPVLLTGGLTGVPAQEPHFAPFNIAVEGPAVGVAPQAATFQFLAAAPGPDGKVVQGAPFRGEGVTEFQQTLADGTKISRSSKSKIARDSAGRTRTEHAGIMIGNMIPEADNPSLITIMDPVARESIILNDKDKTVIVHKMGDMYAVVEDGNNVNVRIERNVIVHKDGEGPAHEGNVTAVAGAMIGGVRMAAPMINEDVRIVTGEPGNNTKTEDLGGQNIEGVFAQGTRTTHTIPTGAIGNNRPIDIVTERWYSPDLQMVVKTVTRDPQSGESTYRLTNIQLGEPDAALFQVPPGYTPAQQLRRVIQRAHPFN